jgi:hypothetical protein
MVVMKEFVTIGALFASDVGQPLVNRLKSMCPVSGGSDNSFLAPMLSPDSDDLKNLLQCLHEAGLSEHDGFGRCDRTKQYRIVANREYAAEELAQVPLLALDWANAKPYILDAGRNPLGLLAIEPKYLPRCPQPKIHTTETAYVVPDPVRHLIEHAGLQRVAFKPTVLTPRMSDGPYVSWESAKLEPWWELTSDKWMPPLSISNDLRFLGTDEPLTEKDRNGRNYGRGIYLREGVYRRPESRYRRNDLQQMLPMDLCDLARTYEPFGHWADSDRRYLIASQRFYRFCVEHDLGGEWVPVRIDPD